MRQLEASVSGGCLVARTHPPHPSYGAVFVYPVPYRALQAHLGLHLYIGDDMDACPCFALHPHCGLGWDHYHPGVRVLPQPLIHHYGDVLCNVRSFVY